MLASIDWYGDTVFNRLQAKRLLREWTGLTEHMNSGAGTKLTDAVTEMVTSVMETPHLYLKFVGD